MSQIARTVIQYSVTPDGAHYWDLDELIKAEDIEPGEGYFSREVDIHVWERQCRPNPVQPIPGWQRLYTGIGKAAHFVDEFASPGDHVLSRCGTPPNADGWRGTGSQSEIDTLASKRDCRSCTNLLKFDENERERLAKMASLRAGRP